MNSLRDEIAAIVWLHKDYSEGYDAADAIMELVQPRIDEQVVWVRDLATDLNNAEARIDKLEAELSDADGLLLRLKDVTSAALKGTDA